MCQNLQPSCFVVGLLYIHIRNPKVQIVQAILNPKNQPHEKLYP